MANRVTQAALEVLTQGPTKARVTQSALEVLTQGPTHARVTQSALEVLTQGPTQARVTQDAVEVLVVNWSTPTPFWAGTELLLSLQPVNPYPLSLRTDIGFIPAGLKVVPARGFSYAFIL